MKKRLLTIFAIVGATSLNAQVQRTPFIEHFTQASCGPCASQNPTMYTTLDNFGSANYVKVTHQVSWPGFDPMYNDFPIGPDARVSYYSVSGVPDCSLNGGATASPNTAVTTTTLNNMAAQTTAYAVTVDHVWNTANDITVNVNVTNTTGATVSSADKIYVTMVENHISYSTPPGTNGETDFYYVMRQMYNASTGAANATTGTALGPINAGATTTFSFNITSLPSYLRDKSQVAFAAYIQNSSTKLVEQAAKSAIVPIPGLINVAAASTSVAGSGYCDYSITPSISFTNNDATDVTEVVAEYSIDGGAPVQQTFTGTLTNGNSTTITFPATSLNPGSSTVSYSIVSVNGGQDWSSPAAVAMDDEVYNKLNAAGVAAPVSEGMETAPLTSGYSRDLTTAIFDAPATIAPSAFGVLDGPTFNYGAIGGFAASNRSIRIRFYDIQSGVMDLVMQKVNLATNSSLTFDHAYRQYQAENDKLQVQVSTDCGATWATVFDKAGTNLMTLPASTTAYVPSAASDWASNTVDLSAYDNTNDVVIRFRATSAYGNNLFLDNINIFQSSASIEEQVAGQFTVYPNPTAGDFTVELANANSNDVVVSVVDMKGQVVSSELITNGQTKVEVKTSSLAAGVYTVRVNSDAGVSVEKVVIK